MNNIEKEALVLFKDFTHLQLKSLLIEKQEELPYTGATENYEETLLNKALEYHRIYNSYKLSNKIDTK